MGLGDGGALRRVFDPRRSVSRTSLASPGRRACLCGLVAGGLAIAFPSGARAQTAATRRYELAIRDRKLADAGVVLRVTEGETVALRWTTDEPVELHLHGYDIEVAATPEAPAIMRFEAFATGRFPINVHGFGDESHDEGERRPVLMYLEVYPR